MRKLRTASSDLVQAEFTAAGCDGWTWAQITGSPDTGCGVGGDRLVPTASMYKLHLLAAACQAITTGALDPRARVTVGPLDGLRGAVGLGMFADLSVRDLMRQMVMVSDNVAAHRLSTLLAPDSIDALVTDLGLERTSIVVTAPERSSGSASSTTMEPGLSPLSGTAEEDAVLHVVSHPAADSDPAAFRSLSTARELCRTIDWFWEDGEDTARRLGREILGQQAWRHRVPSGFPATGVTFHGKTGTIGTFRGEVAVITIDGESPFTVCVMTRAARFGGNLPGVDATIGRVARILVDDLRRST